MPDLELLVIVVLHGVGEDLGVGVVIALGFEFAGQRSVFVKIVYFVIGHGVLQQQRPRRIPYRNTLASSRMTNTVTIITNFFNVSRAYTSFRNQPRARGL